jgi:hypothetical protein
MDGSNNSSLISSPLGSTLSDDQSGLNTPAPDFGGYVRLLLSLSSFTIVTDTLTEA